MPNTQPHTYIRPRYSNFGPSLSGHVLFYGLANEFEEAVEDLAASVIESSQSLIDAMADWAQDSYDYITAECDASHEAGSDFCLHFAEYVLSDLATGSGGNARHARKMADAVEGASSAFGANSRARTESSSIRQDIADD